MTRRAMSVALVLLAVACERSTPRPRPAESATAHDAAPAVAVPGVPADAAPPPQRGLTRGEVALLEPYFRDSIDYATVRVIHGRFNDLQPDATYMTPRGSIFAPDDLWRDDFSAAGVDPGLQATFVHEIVHVWQFQSGKDLIAEGIKTFIEYRGDYEQAYPYKLEGGRDLLDYGMEQQASLVEDWWTMREHGWPPARLVDGPADETTRDAAYRAVLQQFLADPKYAFKVSTDEVARRHIEAAEEDGVGATGGCSETEDEHGRRHSCGWRYDAEPEDN